ncbi:hypothetical protein AALA80_14760 [Oscillospiraceae bacterium 50-60]
MRVFNITFHTINGAFRHQWKTILLFFLSFSILGAGAGWFYQNRLAAEANGSADALPVITFSEEAYQNLTNRLEILSKSCDYTKDYLNVFMSLPDWEKENIVKQNEIFEKEVLDNFALLQETIAELPVYISKEGIDQRTSELEKSLSDYRDSLVCAEEAAQLVGKVTAIANADKRSQGVYYDLLKQASSIGNLKVKIADYERKLEQIQEQPDILIRKSREIDREIDAFLENLNEINKTISDTANDIAENANLLITIETDEDGVVTSSLTHGHRDSSAEENFQILFIFFMLTGLCVGVFFSVYREAVVEEKKKNDNQ